MVVAHAYPDYAQADKAAAMFQDLWTNESVEGRPLAERVPGTLASFSYKAGDLCAAVITINGNGEPHPFDLISISLARGTLPALLIGLE